MIYCMHFPMKTLQPIIYSRKRSTPANRHLKSFPLAGLLLFGGKLFLLPAMRRRPRRRNPLIIELIAMNYPQVTWNNDAPATHTLPHNSVTTHAHIHLHIHKHFRCNFREGKVLLCIDYDDTADDDYLCI